MNKLKRIRGRLFGKQKVVKQEKANLDAPYIGGTSLWQYLNYYQMKLPGFTGETSLWSSVKPLWNSVLQKYYTKTHRKNP